MPTNIRIIHGHEFIKATPEGLLDFEKTKKVLKALALASEHLADHEVILDTRKSHAVMSLSDLHKLVTELSEFPNGFARKTAILCPAVQSEGAELAALCAQNRGFNVRAFTSFEDAIEWLSADAPDVKANDHERLAHILSDSHADTG
jgi:hypothetical protein